MALGRELDEVQKTKVVSTFLKAPEEEFDEKNSHPDLNAFAY